MFARLALGCLFLAAPAAAAESAPVSSPRVTATLVTDTDAAAPGQPMVAGLRLRMAPGWHVYWRNPGEAGQETQFTPELTDGATAGPVGYPAPQRIGEAGITIYGYTGEVMLPVTVTPGAQAGPAFHLSAAGSWLVCQTICVPEAGSFALDLPWGAPASSAPAPSAAAPLLRQAVAHVPGPAPFDAAVSPTGVLTLSGLGLDAADVRGATFFPDGADTIADGAGQQWAAQDGKLVLHLTPGPQFKQDALTGVVVLSDRAGIERAVTVAPHPAPDVPAPEMPAPPVRAAPGLLPAMLLALAGGLLLNLMPCVFPVLAMKAAGLARLGGAGRATVRAEALSYTAGVLLTFCALGGALALTGSRGGWGSQFQSPGFVTGAAWLLFAVGLNLSGVFSVGGVLAGAGGRWAGRAGHVGSFFTGALAVLVAAPCTAPFMGAAVAAALALPPPSAFGVFACMGIGLASPYLLLAAWPGAARALPRPGRWMDVLKGGLAFPMYATAGWLVWVLSTQAGAPGVLVAVSGCVLVGFAAWLSGMAAGAGRRGRQVARALALVSLLAAAALLPGLDAAPPALLAEGPEAFSAVRLAALRAEGRPVFVDMTASWCIPCLINERVALSPASVRQAFADRNVAVLRGDWTRQDPEITAFLRSQDRDGVPLYVFYPPGGIPVILPQLLTAGIVLDHINRDGRS